LGGRPQKLDAKFNSIILVFLFKPTSLYFVSFAYVCIQVFEVDFVHHGPTKTSIKLQVQRIVQL
jgi:hypothetical protein